MVYKLTKKAKIKAEEARISKLTNPHGSYFKIIFSHQMTDTKYNFESIYRTSSISRDDKMKMLRVFGKFIDDTVKMTISEVEKEYKRKPYNGDGTIDPETNTEVQVEHFCLYSSRNKPNTASDGVRMHGYFRNNGGYFVVIRMDWFHNYQS